MKRSPTRITVRTVENASEAEELLPLEGAVKLAGCSRLFLVVAKPTAVRLVLENSGYTISLAGGELTWFEKSLVEDWRPGESA